MVQTVTAIEALCVGHISSSKEEAYQHPEGIENIRALFCTSTPFVVTCHINVVISIPNVWLASNRPLTMLQICKAYSWYLYIYTTYALI